jgi:replicative DNA helicase
MSEAAANITLPHSLEAERAVLAGMLHDSEGLLTGIELLRESNDLWKKDVTQRGKGKGKETTTLFFHRPHQLLFDLLVELDDRGENPSFVSLLEAARRGGVLEEVGGSNAIMDVIQAGATGTNVSRDAVIVREKFLLRRLVFTSNQLQIRALEDREDAGFLISDAEDALRTISENRHTRAFVRIGDVLEEVQDNLKKALENRGMVTGVPTHFTLLDEKTSGLQPSDLIILAARPSVGKTALALNILMNVAYKSRLPVGMFSLEMSVLQIVQRLLCLMARVDLKKLRSGHLSKKESSRVFNNLGHLAPLPIYVDDSPGLTLSSLRSRAVRLKSREPNLSLLVVDYLQLMDAGLRGGQRNRQEEVSAISRGLKELARELHVPVIALSQLSRGVESREGGLPRLSDLRESGAIEQDADVVLFIHRKKPADSEDADEEDVTAEIIIGKQRNGPVGNVPIAFIPNYAMFHNLASFDAPDNLPPDLGDDLLEDVGLDDGVPF